MIGWPVTCVLSLLAGYVLPKLTRKRKVLSWSIIAENALIPSDLRDALSVPITIEVGGVSPKSLTLVTLRIGNAGDEVIENVTAAITVNNKATVLYIKPSEDLGEFQKHVEGTAETSRAAVTFSYLNPRTIVDFELLLSDYEEGSLLLDSSGPGLELRRRDVNRWDFSTSFLKGIGLSVVGVRYDPTANSMSEIAAELKSLRRFLQQK
jgi:hypothetical protein